MSGEAGVRLVSQTPGALPDDLRARYARVATHTHTIRSHDIDFESMKTRLVAWCRERGIRAIGLGSPWEPVSAATYGRIQAIATLILGKAGMRRRRILVRRPCKVHATSGGRRAIRRPKESPVN